MITRDRKIIKMHGLLSRIEEDILRPARNRVRGALCNIVHPYRFAVDIGRCCGTASIRSTHIVCIMHRLINKSNARLLVIPSLSTSLTRLLALEFLKFTTPRPSRRLREPRQIKQTGTDQVCPKFDLSRFVKHSRISRGKLKFQRSE